jgi:hypothetical protein
MEVIRSAEKYYLVILFVLGVVGALLFRSPLYGALSKGAGLSLDFDGIDDYIDCGHDISLDFTDSVTIEVWVNGIGADWSASQRTTSADVKAAPRFQVVGDKIYYVWQGDDHFELWTGEMNTDGSGFSTCKRRDPGYALYTPKLQVVGDKIYYVWREYTGGPLSELYIHTGEMNTDGTGWTVTKQTTHNYVYHPEFQVVGNEIFYTYYRNAGYRQICTAKMGIDGTGWTATQRTSSSRQKYFPQLQVVGNTIYYAWCEQQTSSGTDPYDLWTAEMDTNQTGWSATKRSTASDAWYNYTPRLHVVDNKIYYFWHEDMYGSWYYLYTGEMNRDGTGWSSINRGNAPGCGSLTMQVVGDSIYYNWAQMITDKLWSAQSHIDASGWETEYFYYPEANLWSCQSQIVGFKNYYVFTQDDGGYGGDAQIWTGERGANVVNKGDYYGLGASHVGNAGGFIDAGIDGIKYEAEAIYYSAGARVSKPLLANWNHITITYDKAVLKLYRNGQLVESMPFDQSINTNPFPLIIGDDFDGTIDEVRIWKGVLPIDTIQVWMNKKVIASKHFWSDLQGYWRFDDEVDPTDDYSDQSNMGDLINEPTFTISTAPVGDASIFEISENITETADCPVDVLFGTGNEAPGGSYSLSAIQVNDSPNSTSGLLSWYASTYWEIWAEDDANFDGDYTAVVRFHFDDIPGIVSESEICLYRRDNAAVSSWSEVSAVLNDEGDPMDGVGSMEITISETTPGSFGGQYILTYGESAVELVSFSAIGGYEEVTLEWETRSEFNNREWRIVRATEVDGEFRSIATIVAEGKPHHYHYTDSSLAGGTDYFYKLGDVDENGNIKWHGPVIATAKLCRIVSFAIPQNFPNPFRKSTTIRFSVSGRSHKQSRYVKLQIFDIAGRLINTLVNGERRSGAHEIEWDGEDEHGEKVRSGVYFCRLSAENHTETRKIMVVK